MLRTTIVAAALAACLSIAAAPVRADSVYLIGNSLTWDTQPELLDGMIGHHVDCNKTLPFIHANPASECVASSSDWSLALSSATYDVLTVQPFAGSTVSSTLAEDAAAISDWMAMQPGATVVLHTGWAQHDMHEAAYHGGLTGEAMAYCPEYFDALRSRLLAIDPGRTIVSTDMIGVIDRIYHDIEAGVGPYSALSDLYRDPTHLSYTDGRFLAHNAMRRTLGQPFSAAGFDAVPADHRTYLLAVLENCPADVNRDCVADVFDLLTYLDEWFEGMPIAERGEADGVIDVFDLLAFLDDWFVGC